VKALPRASRLVAEEGLDADGLIDRIAGDVALGIRIHETPRFHCSCDRERATRALKMLEPDELRELIASGQGQEVECHFCGVAYQLDSDELLALVAS